MSAINSTDTIIILGYPSKKEGQPSAILRSRLDKGIELYKKGIASNIILTGSAVRNKNVEAEVMADYCIKAGIPADKLTLEKNAQNTYQNALFTRKIMKARHYRTGTIVTSDFHVHRSRFIFKHFAQDLQFIAAPYPQDAPLLLKYYFMLREKLIIWYLCLLGDKKYHRASSLA